MPTEVENLRRAIVPAEVAEPCRRPACDQPVIRYGRCPACLMWWRRHGTERPEEVIVAHNRRVHEAKALALLVAHAYLR